MPTRVGVKVWPWPASSPAKPVTSSVAEVVISAAPAAPERVEVQQDHQDTQEADGEEAEVLAEQSAHRSTAANANVRTPATFWRRSRSMPMKSPMASASASRASVGT